MLKVKALIINKVKTTKRNIEDKGKKDDNITNQKRVIRL